MTTRTSSLTLALRRALSKFSDRRRSAPVIKANRQGPGAAAQPGETGPSANWLALG